MLVGMSVVMVAVVVIVSSVLCFHESGCSGVYACGDGSSGCDRGLCVVLVTYLVVLVQ